MYTAFPFENQLYKFPLMLFKSSNWTQAFTTSINKVVGDAVNEYCMYYVNEIQMFLKSMQDHFKHINNILSLSSCKYNGQATEVHICADSSAMFGTYYLSDGYHIRP